MKNVLLGAAALVGTIVLSPFAYAQHEGNAFIHAWDRDGDGKVTRAEYDAARTDRFNATDTNKDGWVSDAEYLAEYSARLEQQLAASGESEEKKTEERQRQVRQTHVRFGVLDTDKNKQMGKAEYDVSGGRAFAEMDDDKDGVITAADGVAVAAKQAKRQRDRDAN